MSFQLLAEQQLMLAYALFVSPILGNVSISWLHVYAVAGNTVDPLLLILPMNCKRCSQIPCHDLHIPVVIVFFYITTSWAGFP